MWVLYTNAIRALLLTDLFIVRDLHRRLPIAEYVQTVNVERPARRRRYFAVVVPKPKLAFCWLLFGCLLCGHETQCKSHNRYRDWLIRRQRRADLMARLRRNPRSQQRSAAAQHNNDDALSKHDGERITYIEKSAGLQVEHADSARVPSAQHDGVLGERGGLEEAAHLRARAIPEAASDTRPRFVANRCESQTVSQSANG